MNASRSVQNGEPSSTPAIQLVLKAASAGDLATIKKLVSCTHTELKADPKTAQSNRRDSDGKSHTEHAINSVNNKSGGSSRILASAGTHPQTLHPDAQLDAQGWTALHHACYHGHVEVARLLIDMTADVHARTTEGWLSTPLHRAAAGTCQDPALVHLLLEHSAMVDEHALSNFTPLHDACRYGHAVYTRALLECKADANARVKGNRRTPLFYAAGYGNIECMKVLLRCDADGNSTDGVTDTKNSATHSTGTHGCPEVSCVNTSDTHLDHGVRNEGGDHPSPDEVSAAGSSATNARQYHHGYKKANAWACDKSKRTALLLAKEYHQSKAVALLERYMSACENRGELPSNPSRSRTKEETSNTNTRKQRRRGCVDTDGQKREKRKKAEGSGIR